MAFNPIHILGDPCVDSWRKIELEILGDPFGEFLDFLPGRLALAQPIPVDTTPICVPSKVPTNGPPLSAYQKKNPQSNPHNQFPGK
jgi:hypothetical protein